MYSITGQEIVSRAIVPGSVNNLSYNFPTGCYVVRIITMEQSLSEKVIVE